MYILLIVDFFSTNVFAHGDKHAQEVNSFVTGNRVISTSTSIEKGNIFIMIDMHTLTITLGVLTFICLLLTNISGIYRWPLKYHKAFAFLTVFLAICHAGIVIFF